MSKLSTEGPQGNPSPIFAYFNDPLDRVETRRAERTTWHDYRTHALRFEADPTLANEIKALAARSAWHAAWRAVNENTDRGAA